MFVPQGTNNIRLPVYKSTNQRRGLSVGSSPTLIKLGKRLRLKQDAAAARLGVSI